MNVELFPCLPNENIHTVINCPNEVNETLRSSAFVHLWDHVFISGPVYSRPLEGAQLAVLLGIYKSFRGFGAFMQLAMPLILMFLLVLAGLSICLFIFTLSLYLELLQGEGFLLN